MSAFFHIAVIQYQDQVGVANGGQAVGNKMVRPFISSCMAR